MSSKRTQQLSAQRLLLQNPYAHIEDLEERYIQRLHENPYLYANQRCADDAEAILSPSTQKKHTVPSIERKVKELQKDIWSKRKELGLPADVSPVDVLQPKYAAQILGYSYYSQSNLGWLMDRQNPIRVAGSIDNSEMTIKIAHEIDCITARFTGAHEIGHAVLHPHMPSLHRDRSLNGTAKSHDRIEYEADKFAAFFLMPSKLVREQFLSRFLAPFKLQEETSYALLGKSYSVVRELLPTRRDISLYLAKAFQFNGRTFSSLSKHFVVSDLAMAIRLEELELVES